MTTNAENSNELRNEEELGIIEASKFSKKVKGANFDKSESKPINTSHQDCAAGKDEPSRDDVIISWP